MNEAETLPAPILPLPSTGKWRQEQMAFRLLLPQLLKTHLGQFVAIHEGQVVESGDNKLAIASRAYARFGYIPIYVSQVVPKPEIVRIPSPRLLSGG